MLTFLLSLWDAFSENWQFRRQMKLARRTTSIYPHLHKG